MNERRCIVTRQSRPRDELIRFVAGPDGRVVPDLKCRLPGRGCWVTANAATVARAAAKGIFARALKTAATADEGLAGLVGGLLRTRALEALGLAARAGAVISGFTKVERAARAGRLALVLQASDGAADGRRKIAAVCAAAGPRRPRIAEVFTSEQLGLALGRTNVVHAGAASGRMAASLEAALARYERYCDGAGADVRAA